MSPVQPRLSNRDKLDQLPVQPVISSASGCHTRNRTPIEFSGWLEHRFHHNQDTLPPYCPTIPWRCYLQGWWLRIASEQAAAMAFGSWISQRPGYTSLSERLHWKDWPAHPIPVVWWVRPNLNIPWPGQTTKQVDSLNIQIPWPSKISTHSALNAFVQISSPVQQYRQLLQNSLLSSVQWCPSRTSLW